MTDLNSDRLRAYGRDIYVELWKGGDGGEDGPSAKRMTEVLVDRHGNLVPVRDAKFLWMHNHITKPLLKEPGLVALVAKERPEIVEEPFLPGIYGDLWESLPETFTLDDGAGDYNHPLKQEATFDQALAYLKLLDQKADEVVKTRDNLRTLVDTVRPFADRESRFVKLLALAVGWSPKRPRAGSGVRP